ncbi:MAG: DUF2752 domain-containing protein [Lachnospiraceae bacterium]
MSSGQKKRVDEDEILYRLLLCLVGLGVIYLIPVLFCDFDPMYGVNGNMPCLIHTVTGGYCPGCGGTRAVAALLKGEILQSLYYNPFVLYMAAGIAAFLLSHTLKHLTKNRIHGLHCRSAFFYVGFGILAVNMLIKNYCYFVLGIAMS